ncbi:MAG TPA: DUF448 domain-containing protein [Thermoleophilia bacterium]|nr:DUF448 domain-containing protein [Thermoleophilia bacterium]
MSAPLRTCLGCRDRRAQTELIRLQLREGRVVPCEGRPIGRGAYLCPDRACFDAALRRRAFVRAFRSPVHVDERLWDAVEARMSGPDRERR